MFKNIFSSFVDSWKTWPGLQLGTFLSLVSCFFVLTITVSSLRAAYSFLNNIQDQPHFMVFFNEKVNPKRVSQITKLMEEKNVFKKIEFLSSKDIYNQIKKSDDLSFFFDYDLNSIPPMIQAHFALDHLKNKKQVTKTLSLYKKELLVLPEVENVFYGDFWLNEYFHLFFGFKIFGFSVLFSLLISCLFMIAYCMKNNISHRKKEIQLYQLLGFSSQKICIPFLVESISFGFLSSFLGLVLGKTFFIFLSFYLSEKNIWIQSHLFSETGIIIEFISILFLGSLSGIFGFTLVKSYFNVDKKRALV